MDSGVWVGATFGALVSMPGSIGLTRIRIKWTAKQRLRDARFDLVTTIASHKSGPNLVAALNQVPVLFGHDEAVLEQWRAGRASPGARPNMDAVVNLLGLLAEKVGLPASVTKNDLAAGFAG